MKQRYENVTCKRHEPDYWRACTWALAGCFLSLIPWAAQSAASPLPVLELHAELRVPTDATNKAYQFVPASKLVQGQEVFYTLRIYNPTDKALNDVQIAQAMPTHTHYVAGSASGAGAEISFSIDAGRSFAKASDLKAANGLAAQYTHIRWQLPYPLAPKAVVLARFRAVFQ